MAKYIAHAAMDIDYDNFKDTIPNKERLRHDAYSNCWEAMWQWQSKIKLAEEAISLGLMKCPVMRRC